MVAHSGRILFVDDDADMRDLVDAALAGEGFDVRTCAGGEAALALLGQEVVDAVVTDLNMPVMDGITLIKELRNIPEYKFIPILMLTTESQDEKKKQGRAAGATGWMIKPFNPEQLMSVVSKVVR